MRLALSIILLSSWVSTAIPAASQDFSKGIAALRQNDFATAAGELKPFAKSGDVNAQFAMGWMYLHGAINTEIETDAIEAMYWFRKAADQGDDQSQLILGRIYANGDGNVGVGVGVATGCESSNGPGSTGGECGPGSTGVGVGDTGHA